MGNSSKYKSSYGYKVDKIVFEGKARCNFTLERQASAMYVNIKRGQDVAIVRITEHRAARELYSVITHDDQASNMHAEELSDVLRVCRLNCVVTPDWIPITRSQAIAQEIEDDP